ncbi:unnamed protein product [Caenorhabditis brenneri]
MSSRSSGSKGGKWTRRLHFWNGNEWKKYSADQLIEFFENELDGKKEVITFAEIRMYSLVEPLVTPRYGIWHEYTLLKTTNWWWSFEKNMEGIYVQRSKNKDDVQKKFGTEDRRKDFPLAEPSRVSYGENIVHVAKWIIKRQELDNTYHLLKRNCQVFAALLYELIVRCKFFFFNFWNGNEWEKYSAGQLIEFFENELDGKKEKITFAEIRKYSLVKHSVTQLFGVWHEYTLVKTTNWWWSFEKTMEGIFVQRKKEKSQVQQEFGNEVRQNDIPEGRSSDVLYGENIEKIADWIFNRDELNNTYDVRRQNCHFFASLLYEAITRTVRGRRLSIIS